MHGHEAQALVSDQLTVILAMSDLPQEFIRDCEMDAKKVRSFMEKHWEAIYTSKDLTHTSWFEGTPSTSIQAVQKALTFLGQLDPFPNQIDSDSANLNIIDVGGGNSNLAQFLLQLRFSQVTVFDISQAALQANRERIGHELAQQVIYLTGDVTRYSLKPMSYDIWHDRAVFHFMTTETMRERYIENCRSAVRPGGVVIIGTTCSKFILQFSLFFAKRAPRVFRNRS